MTKTTTFTISNKEQKKIDAFLKKQDRIMRNVNVGAIGGAYTYHFTPTSIGVIIEIENTVTKEKINVTDYDLW